MSIFGLNREGLTEEDLLCRQIGGVGSILETLLHIVDVADIHN